MGKCQASLKGNGTWLRPAGPGMEGRAYPAAPKAAGPYLPWRRDHHGTQHFPHPIALLVGAPCQLDLMGTCQGGHMAWGSPMVPMPIVPAQNTWLAQDAQLQHADMMEALALLSSTTAMDGPGCLFMACGCSLGLSQDHMPSKQPLPGSVGTLPCCPPACHWHCTLALHHAALHCDAAKSVLFHRQPWRHWSLQVTSICLQLWIPTPPPISLGCCPELLW